MKKLFKLVTSRVFIIASLIFIQLLILVMSFVFLSAVYIPVYIFFMVLGFVLAVIIINTSDSPMFKVAWLIPVLSFPIGGALFYLLFGSSRLNRKNREKLRKAVAASEGLIEKDEELLKRIKAENGNLAREAEYIVSVSASNVYRYTQTRFLSPGSAFFAELLPELKKAKEFIFLEYFIIGEGQMWSQIKEILLQKQSEGVEIRLLYDDFGSINTVPKDFAARLNAEGIRTAVFNQFRPSLDKFLNYRDHRKFAIIDNRVAFTGGVNIADEYINKKQRFGYWADATVKVSGDAVSKITSLFLEMWYFTTGEEQNYRRYLQSYPAREDGLVVPFADDPLLSEAVCETAYINLINNATDYIYICTPYLILDNVMTEALTTAAKSGVRVVIITPHTPDKKIVFSVTRANYKPLVDAGVEVYEFTPGFMHTKMIISDDSTAIVGTSNFDYRSFYLHFENGVWMHGSCAVTEARDSFLNIMNVSERITREFCDNVSLPVKIGRSVVNLFSPLM